jgi:hypothetical protein
MMAMESRGEFRPAPISNAELPSRVGFRGNSDVDEVPSAIGRRAQQLRILAASCDAIHFRQLNVGQINDLRLGFDDDARLVP